MVGAREAEISKLASSSRCWRGDGQKRKVGFKIISTMDILFRSPLSG